jgi:hypothetical protein
LKISNKEMTLVDEIDNKDYIEEADDDSEEE